MVHVNVGTANALCGIINGWRGNIPVLFTAGMALRPEAWYTDYGDGVRFAVDIATAGSQPVEVYGQRLNPRANTEERRWVEVRLPLASYLGQTIEITLRTDPVDDVRNDWAFAREEMRARGAWPDDEASQRLVEQLRHEALDRPTLNLWFLPRWADGLWGEP